MDNSIGPPGEGGDYLGENLIFIISQPRSGSTLLQRILAGHPDIATAAETWLMLHPLYGTRKRGVSTEFNSVWAAHAVGQFLDNYAFGQATYDRGIRAFAQRVYGDALARSARRFFVDKTPRYFFIIPDLYRLFPQARFIFLLRSPMAVLYSELNTYVKGKWPMLARFAPDLLEAPRRIVDGMALLGEAAIVVRYAELVAEPQRWVRELCGRLGIDYLPEMIDYGNTPAPKGVANDPVGIHKHTRPSAAGVGKWKEMAADPQLWRFAEGYADALGPELLDGMGYSHGEIREVLGAVGPCPTAGPLFPWELAIRPEDQWSARDRFRAERYFATVDNGPLRGPLKAGMHAGMRALRALRRHIT